MTDLVDQRDRLWVEPIGGFTLLLSAIATVSRNALGYPPWTWNSRKHTITSRLRPGERDAPIRLGALRTVQDH